MKVYHGSTVVVSAPLAAIGRRNLDFGLGFYVTDLEEQAVSWASRPMNEGKPVYLNIYELDIESMLEQGYRYKQFGAYSEEWLQFVVANRRGERRWREFDVVEGGIANDRVFNTIELYAAGLTPMEEALRKLRYEHPNNQICILRQEVIDRYLHFLEAKPIEI